MSFIKGIDEPKDMLLKLIREGNRINFENCTEDLTDHLFNFSVTAHSLRDWCIKFRSVQTNRKSMNQNWDSKPFLVVAKDIANSVKHFGIEMYTPELSGSVNQSASFVEFKYGEDIPEKIYQVMNDESFRNSQAEPGPSYIINFQDGSSITMNDYIFKTINYWIEYFDENNIPRYTDYCAKHIYLNRPFWLKLTQRGAERVPG